jgi:hypothetical protein
MPRFVILEHDHPHQHWDLLLESGSVLRAWRLSAFLRDNEAIAARASFDHRLIYLDYEGPVSGGRGQVVRREQGTFKWELDSAERVIVRLHGTRLQGRLQLAKGEGENWTAEFRSAASAS